MYVSPFKTTETDLRRGVAAAFVCKTSVSERITSPQIEAMIDVSVNFFSSLAVTLKQDQFPGVPCGRCCTLEEEQHADGRTCERPIQQLFSWSVFCIL